MFANTRISAIAHLFEAYMFYKYNYLINLDYQDTIIQNGKC